MDRNLLNFTKDDIKIFTGHDVDDLLEYFGNKYKDNKQALDKFNSNNYGYYKTTEIINNPLDIVKIFDTYYLINCDEWGSYFIYEYDEYIYSDSSIGIFAYFVSYDQNNIIKELLESVKSIKQEEEE